MRRSKLIRTGADWAPAGVVTAGGAVALVAVFGEWSTGALAGLWIVSFAARSVAPVHQHCHAHHGIFHPSAANALYDVILMVAAGNLTVVWELQHVQGHHRMYLRGHGDPANQHRFGRRRGQRLVFTILGDALSFWDALAISAGQPRQRARLIGHQLLQLAILGALVSWAPVAGFVFFVVPWVLLRWTVFWFSYAQHDDVPLTDVYTGSVTHLGLTNRLYLNVGHHTAHHEKPTLHWTRLPARTAQILHRIPSSCVR